MSRTAAIAAAAVVAIAAAGAGYWIGTQRPPAGPPGSMANAGGPPKGGGAGGPPGGSAGGGGQVVAVEAVQVVTAPMPQTITAVGSLRSDESVTLRPESAGRISAITFQEGQRVQKGAPLVKLDAGIPDAEYAQAKANLTLAKAKFDRAVDLANRNYISGQAKDEAENSYKVAQATLQLAEAKLAKTEIRAPFSGIIGLRSVSVGDYVKEGADLVNLESIDPLKVDFRVPETYLRQVQPGQLLTIALDAMPGGKFDGKVIAVNPLVDAAGRSIVIRAQVRNQDTVLRPGMFARVRLITKEQADAMVLPEQALVPQGTEQYVFRILDSKVARVKVETGQRRDGMVEVISGLKAGDLVVTAGQLKLRDGAAVSVAGREVKGDKGEKGKGDKAAPGDDKAGAAPSLTPAAPAATASAGGGSASPIAPANAAAKSGDGPARPPRS